MCKILMFTDGVQAQAAHDELDKFDGNVFIAEGVDQVQGSTHYYLYVPWELECKNPGLLDAYTEHCVVQKIPTDTIKNKGHVSPDIKHQPPPGAKFNCIFGHYYWDLTEDYQVIFRKGCSLRYIEGMLRNINRHFLKAWGKAQFPREVWLIDSKGRIGFRD